MACKVVTELIMTLVTRTVPPSPPSRWKRNIVGKGPEYEVAQSEISFGEWVPNIIFDQTIKVHHYRQMDGLKES